MEITIGNNKVKGQIVAPPSKSQSIRAIAAAALCSSESVISNYSKCDDALAAIDIIKALGSNVKFIKKDLYVTGGKPTGFTKLNCRESALCLRLFSVIASLFDCNIELIAEKSLLMRKTENIEDILYSLGVDSNTNNGYPPIKVKGPMTGGKIQIDCSKSSQILSGLLYSLPLAKNDSIIEVTNLKSMPYIALTLDILSKYGIEIQNELYEMFKIKGNQIYKPANIKIEGDWSCAANFLVVAAIRGEVSISNLNINSLQGDKVIIELLKDIGASVLITENSVKVSTNKLNSYEFDAGDYPDLVPILAVLGCFCKGVSVINDISRLSGKESSRAEIIAKELNSIGGKIRLEENKMFINKCELRGGIIDSHGDHRIAMALAVAGLSTSEPLTIENAECVGKSYPDFWDNFEF